MIVNNPCVDKVVFWIDVEVVGESGIQTICKHLNISKPNQRVYINNISVKMLSNGVITGVGSFPKFLNGDNLHTITLAETETVVDALSDAMGVDISGARVTQLEYGANYELSHPVSDYIELLGIAPRTTRCERARKSTQLETITYDHTGKEMLFSHIFYDKSAEMKISGNLLRYELRFKKRIAKRIGYKRAIRLSDLSTEMFSNRMRKLYIDFYNSIDKKKEFNMNPSGIKKPKDAEVALFSKLLQDADIKEIECFMSILKGNRVFADPKSYSRLKFKINQVKNNRKFVSNVGLINELDVRVKSGCFSGKCIV